MPEVRCSVCKEPIGPDSIQWVCSVSTCTRGRAAVVFCSPSCWDTHSAVMRHRDAWCEEAPPAQDAAPQTPERASTPEPTRRIIRNAPASPQPIVQLTTSAVPKEILIVVSKLKDYIQHRAQMNTAGSVAAVLSDIVRKLCDEAIESARRDNRKTVMDRDFRQLG